MKFIAGLLLCLLCLTVRGADEPPELKSNGLPAGNPEAVLPGGAVVHVRANNLANLVNTLNDLIMSFVPEKAVPKEMQEILKQPKPVLAYIGMMTGGQPLTVEDMSATLGVALDKPVSLSFYPMNPAEGFVLSVPMKDPKTITALLMNALRPRKFAPIAIGDKQAFHIIGTSPDMPRELYVACSEDRAYICGSPMLVQMLFAADQPRLDKGAMISQALTQHAASDVTLMLNTEVVKPLLERVRKMYSTIPPNLIAQLRQELMREIPPQQLVQINMRLRFQMGINDVQQGLDYIEAASTATYEVLVSEVLDRLTGIDGLAISFGVGAPLQKFNLSFYSKDLKAAAGTQPLPMAEVTAALAKIPGSRNTVAITGREPKAEPSKLLIKWADALKAKFAAKNLPLEFVNQFGEYARQLKAEQSIESQVPWTLRTSYSPPAAAVAPAKTLAEYLKNVFGGPAAKYTLTVIPGQDEALLEKHFAGVAQTTAENQKASKVFLANADQSPPALTFTSRFQAQPTNGKARKLVFENVWTTSSGFFGYSQHELINRQIMYSVKHGDYLFMHDSIGTADTWLNGIDALPVSPVAPAITRMFELAPKDATSLQFVRVMNEVAVGVKQLQELEDVARVELDGYLAKATEILKAEKPAKDKLAALSEIEPPLLMHSLNMGKDGQPYIVLIGDLRYPRPKFVPIIANLLKDFVAKAEDVGGALAYERVQDGRLEGGAVISTEAIALLVKTTVNSVFENYVIPADGQAKLREALGPIGVGPGTREEALLFNPTWDGLNFMMMGAKPKRQREAVKKVPAAKDEDDEEDEF
jgi:hypothetical protein